MTFSPIKTTYKRCSRIVKLKIIFQLLSYDIDSYVIYKIYVDDFLFESEDEEVTLVFPGLIMTIKRTVATGMMILVQ